MADIQERIQKEAKKLLTDKSVEVVVGFEKGTLPYRTSPVFIRLPEEVEKLVWNSFCENNLASLLSKVRDTKAAVIAKGCDSRAIEALILEKQLRRDNLIIIGIPCTGILDRRRIVREAGGEIREVIEKKNELIIKGKNFEKNLAKDEYLYSICKTCAHHNPAEYDILIGEKVENDPGEDDFADVIQFEKKSSKERWAYFTKEMSRCIRCYACREACPMCYCDECFVDSTRPVWIEKGLESTDVAVWHIIRAYHQTGRCVDCGSCEQACPMDINLRFLTRKINKDVKDLFDFESGLDRDTPTPLATFRLDDNQDFIK